MVANGRWDCTRSSCHFWDRLPVMSAVPQHLCVLPWETGTAFKGLNWKYHTAGRCWSWLYTQCRAQSVLGEFSTLSKSYMEKLLSPVKIHGLSSGSIYFHVVPQTLCSLMACEVLYGLCLQMLPPKGWLLPLSRWSTRILRLPGRWVAAPRQTQYWELKH